MPTPNQPPPAACWQRCGAPRRARSLSPTFTRRSCEPRRWLRSIATCRARADRDAARRWSASCRLSHWLRRPMSRPGRCRRQSARLTIPAAATRAISALHRRHRRSLGVVAHERPRRPIRRSRTRLDLEPRGLVGANISLISGLNQDFQGHGTAVLGEVALSITNAAASASLLAPRFASSRSGARRPTTTQPPPSFRPDRP